MSKIFNYILFIAIVFAGIYYQDALRNVWSQAFNNFFPCRQAITYSIDSFDTRFGVSKETFLGAMKDAEAIWEKPIGKDLFKYSTDGHLKVNLIYDSRQETTQILKNMGVVVENSRASYDSLKSKYDSLIKSYEQNKAIFESRFSAFESRKKNYEAEVTASNRKGGASKETFARLNAEKEYLNQEITYLNILQTELSSQVEDINALAKALNQLATTLNLNVKQYNTIGSSLGGEFEEGTYVRDESGARIDIYQFDNRTKLVRVLAHELGHALGLDHIEDPKAIMYRLNNGINEKLTNTDIVELKNLCGIK